MNMKVEQADEIEDGIVIDVELEGEGTGVQPLEGEGTGEGTVEEEMVLTIGDSPTPINDVQEDEVSRAPEWVRELRKTNRDLAKRNKELEQRFAETTKSNDSKPKLGPKPKVEDFDFDTTKFEAALDTWYSTKREVEEAEKAEQNSKIQAEQEWNKTLGGYKESKTKLKFKNVDDAEALAFENLDVTQQGIILQGCENPALVIYAIGASIGAGSEEAKKLSSIKDPVKFATAVGKFEVNLKMTKRTSNTPPPEKTISGNGGLSKSGAVDKTLERLEQEADRTGNRTKVQEYKRRLKEKSKS